MQELAININDMSINQKLESGKIKVIVLDGVKGTATICEAAEHGETVIETINGKTKRISFRESELI
nr:XtrA/YqaO family protein [Cytobacillus spongiae]